MNRNETEVDQAPRTVSLAARSTSMTPESNGEAHEGTATADVVSMQS